MSTVSSSAGVSSHVGLHRLLTSIKRGACFAALITSPLLCDAQTAVTVAVDEVPTDKPSSHAQALDRVNVTGGRPSTLPLEIPTTTESIGAERIAQRLNATDAEDALKYFPSLNVRKRYIGDYDHAVLATRASGTGNSARSLVYADGVLLSNLLGNGASYTPRWGLITPEEIERVDVMYGPFSAAYPGNSAGAVVDYVTRMPQRFEAHLKLQAFTQIFRLYGTHERESGGAGSASLGSREGDWSWWVNFNRLASRGQPIAFANRLKSASTEVTDTASGIAVSGAVSDTNPAGADWWILGATNRNHTVQDHAKIKLAYDLSATLRATYTLGLWTNTVDRTVESYLRDATGRPVTQGSVIINGRQYRLLPTDFATGHGELTHLAHGLTVKSNTRGLWDWEATASLYDYQRDRSGSSAIAYQALPGETAPLYGAGLTDMAGTGWNTLAFKGTWRPAGPQGTHVVEAGLQRDAFQLRTQVSRTDEVTSIVSGMRNSSFQGDSSLYSLWAQDAWRLAHGWRAVLGGRWEHWRAFDGAVSDALKTLPFDDRQENYFSPKAALSFSPDADWTLKASLGRAVRMPTVAELYQGTTSNITTVYDPNLKPEVSWTSEWTAERALSQGHLRATLFHERTRDALYSQTNMTITPNVTSVQNIDAVHTTGVEVALSEEGVWLRGLDFDASLTYADSKIVRNDVFPASVGKRQPRVPSWRSTASATYRAGDAWAMTLGLRYSGRQYGSLDNSDAHGDTYTGVSRFLVADVRVQYRINANWSAALGVDNLNNASYWAFHPYTQRTLHVELRFDQ